MAKSLGPIDDGEDVVTRGYADSRYARTVGSRQGSNLAYLDQSGNPTGAYVIRTSVSFSSWWLDRVVIDLYEYNSTQTITRYIGGAYAYGGTNTPVNHGYIKVGQSPADLRWGRDPVTDELLIIIGDVSTTWSYPKISVSYASWTGSNGTSWSITRETDLSAYTVWGSSKHEVWHSSNFDPATKSDTTHDHDGRYYTESEVDALLAGKSGTAHTHDDRYYTETEVDSLLSGKSDTSHTHAANPPLADAAPPNPVFGTASAVGTSGDAAREDHVHALGTPGTPVGTSSSSGAAGTSAVPARSDHRHGFSAGTPVLLPFGSTATAGSASSLSRSDHRHAMPADPVPPHEAATDPHSGYALADGSRPFSGPVTVPLGSNTAPGLAFSGLATTGLAADSPFGVPWLHFVVNGSAVMAMSETTINVNSRRITNLATPTGAQDAATKDYVDSNAGGDPMADVFLLMGA